MSPDFLRRVRWGNVARALAIAGVLAALVVSPWSGSEEPPGLPPASVAPADRVPAAEGAVAEAQPTEPPVMSTTAPAADASRPPAPARVDEPVRRDRASWSAARRSGARSRGLRRERSKAKRLAAARRSRERKAEVGGPTRRVRRVTAPASRPAAPRPVAPPDTRISAPPAVPPPAASAPVTPAPRGVPVGPRGTGGETVREFGFER